MHLTHVQNFPKNFHVPMCVSGGKKYLFFGKFCALLDNPFFFLSYIFFLRLTKATITWRHYLISHRDMDWTKFVLKTIS